MAETIQKNPYSPPATTLGKARQHDSDGSIGRLIAVIIIGGIIVFLVGAALWGGTSKEVRVAVYSLETLEKPVEQYIATHHKFPASVAAITETGEAPLFNANLVLNPDELYLEAVINEHVYEPTDDIVLGSLIIGKSVRLIFDPLSGTWTCSADYPNGIPQIFLPRRCKRE